MASTQTTSTSTKTTLTKTTRRSFLKTAGGTVGVVAVASTMSPLILRATDKAGSKLPVIGKGSHKYEVHHHWGTLPQKKKWGITHGVAIDSAGLVYIKQLDRTGKADAIVVFDAKGKFVRSFGSAYSRGGHGIDLRKEGKEEFLYLSCIREKFVAKTTLTGKEIWRMGVPEKPKNIYGAKKVRYAPTNLAFAPDGGIYVGDGYGSHYVHHYDKKNQLVNVFGGKGDGKGQLTTPHSIWLDDRPGREPSLVVADRGNARLQYFSLAGKYLSEVKGFELPCDIDIRGDEMLVADLLGRLTLLDKNNKVIVHLGYSDEWHKTLKVKGQQKKIRLDRSKQPAGKFVTPHDACFDKSGNIFVTEWMPGGRVSFLRKLN